MASKQEPQRVSAADFIRGFSAWRLRAARKPVVVTHHGKDAHVLISLEDYRRLDGDGAAPTIDALRDAQAGLLESIRDAIIVIDRQWRIVAVNPAASDMFEHAASSLLGERLAAAWPAIEGSLLMPHIARMLDHRERFSGDIPDLFRPRHWLRVDLVPATIGGAIILRDVSDTIEGISEADVRRAMAEAIELDATIGHARISVREAVEGANPALALMVGTDEAAIRRVRFSALLSVGMRQAFVEALEEVFRTGMALCIASELVTREGGALPVSLSIVERRGAYASEGALILVTRR